MVWALPMSVVWTPVQARVCELVCLLVIECPWNIFPRASVGAGACPYPLRVPNVRIFLFSGACQCVSCACVREGVPGDFGVYVGVC